MSIAQNKEIARRFFTEQDRRKGPLAEELCAPNYVVTIAGNPSMSFEGHGEFGRMFYAAFPDLKHNIEDTIAEGDKVVVQFTLQGTHNGDFLGIPPTGKQVSVAASAVLHFAGDKVAEVQGIFDQLGLMRQLGVIPSSTTA
jgi:steroid delta-isomerase-like uncharacterized protein